MSIGNVEIDKEQIYSYLIKKVKEIGKHINKRLPQITKDLERINTFINEFFLKNQDLKNLFKSSLY